ncbi:MAG: redoxin domain-containing protein [Verrucomicrobia bacterium]|nr:redoxin domain-containing protein [Verrucomicrobiota bacterium]
MRLLHWMSVCFLLGAATADSGPVADGRTCTERVIPNFRLLDHRGISHELYRMREPRFVVLFVTGNGCPIARHSIPELKALREQVGPGGAEFLLINANPHDTRSEVAAEAGEFGVEFPVLLDPSQAVARALELRRTAEVLVIETGSWMLRYRGAVDDRLDYGQQKPAPTQRFLADALAALIAGNPVATPRSAVRGCVVRWTAPETVDYVRDVAPIIVSRCVGCHSRGQVAPFAFDRFEKVRGHAGTVREVLLEDRMPPWHADPHQGAFANDRGLTPSEKSLLMAWIDAGTPRGEGADPLPSAQPASGADWPLGRPDHVVTLPEPARIPATGLVPYQTFTVKAPVTGDAWLRGVTIRPGNARVVHHCLVFVRYPEALRHREPPQDEGTAGFFAGFVPGSDPVMFPAGTGKFLPQGAEFVFQMHYTTTGREETDRTEMALYLAPEPPASELVTAAVTTGDFEIPPGVRTHPVRAEIRLEQDTWLHEFTPHMPLGGSRVAYPAVYPDGREEILLSVPAYDFNWQTLYRLKTPLRVPAGTRLVCSGAFDNSASNPANPDPGATVRFGEQTQDEMFIGYFNYARAIEGR